MIATFAICAALTACSSSSDGAKVPATSTTTVSSTTVAKAARTTTTAPAVESTSAAAVGIPSSDELGASIAAFWALYVELGSSKAPFNPAIRQRLEERTTGAELTTLFDYFQSNALAGYYLQGGISSSITVVSATATEAQVSDCYDDTTGLYRISNDQRVDTDDPARHQVVYTLVNEGGVWKVGKIRDEGLGLSLIHI